MNRTKIVEVFRVLHQYPTRASSKGDSEDPAGRVNSFFFGGRSQTQTHATHCPQVESFQEELAQLRVSSLPAITSVPHVSSRITDYCGIESIESVLAFRRLLLRPFL